MPSSEDKGGCSSGHVKKSHEAWEKGGQYLKRVAAGVVLNHRVRWGRYMTNVCVSKPGNEILQSLGEALVAIWIYNENTDGRWHFH